MWGVFFFFIVLLRARMRFLIWVHLQVQPTCSLGTGTARDPTHSLRRQVPNLGSEVPRHSYTEGYLASQRKIAGHTEALRACHQPAEPWTGTCYVDSRCLVAQKRVLIPLGKG